MTWQRQRFPWKLPLPLPSLKGSQSSRRSPEAESSTDSSNSLAETLSPPSSMKVSAALLCLLLAVAALGSQVLGHRAPSSVIGPTVCCINMANRSISVKRLESYRRLTSSRCPLEAVIFRTKQAKDVCANPKDKWVQRAMKYLDQKSQTPKP